MRPSGPSETEAAKWDAMYKELEGLEAYHREHGHSNVPSTLKNKLSRWVGKQRQHRRQMEAYPVERIARLDRLRFSWGSTQRQTATTNTPEQDTRWREMYEKLKTYKAENGHCKVPVHANAGDPELGPLGTWVAYQRRTHDRMAQSRKGLLDAIGFHWYADNWDTMYDELVKFRGEHGHTNVPIRYVANRSLGVWCNKQRRYMRQNKVPPERRRRLEHIGFDFEPQSEKNERIWNEKFQRLKEYKREHGDCLVPTKSSTKGADDEELSVWVTRQRMSYRCGKLPNHRMQKLEEVGFVWSIVERRGPQSLSEKQEVQWERSFEELREFYEKEGHFIVPAALENGKVNPLSAWVSQQRRVYALGEIKKERRLKLDAINFVWREVHAHESQRRFDRAFNSLNEFKMEKGHTFVRKSDDIVLWRWARKMRWKHKRGTLSPEREERLESIGFWGSPPPGYQERGENGDGSEIEDSAAESDDDDERKPSPKRRRISSSSPESAEEKEEFEQKSTGVSSRYTVGTRVKKFFEGYGWFSGEIVSVDDDCWHIRYEDGDEENYLVEELDDLDKIVANARTA